MQTRLSRRKAGDIEFGIIYGLIALLGVLAARFLPLCDVLPDCVFKSITGVPCPSCGSTRALVNLAHGNVAGALKMNPLIALAFFFACFAFLYGLFTLVFDVPRVRIELSEREKDVLRVAAILLLAGNWLYLLRVL